MQRNQLNFFSKNRRRLSHTWKHSITFSL